MAPKTAHCADSTDPQHRDRGAVDSARHRPVTGRSDCMRGGSAMVGSLSADQLADCRRHRSGGWTSGAIWSVSGYNRPYGLRRVPLGCTPGSRRRWSAGIVTAAGIMGPIGNVCALCQVVGPRRRRTVVVACGAPGRACPRPGRSAPAWSVRCCGRGALGQVALRSGGVDRHQSPWHLLTSALVTVTPARAQCRWAGPVDVPGDGSTVAG